MPDSYHVKVLSPKNVVEIEENVLPDELLDKVRELTGDYLDVYLGYSIEITANN